LGRFQKKRIGEVQKAVGEQRGVESQRKEVNVGDYVKTATIGQLLKRLEFPAGKDNKYFGQQISPKKGNKTVLNTLLKFEEGKQY